jgi:hypothetical protein
MFPGKVKSAYIVRDTGDLLAKVQSRALADQHLKEAQGQWEKAGKPAERPMVRASLMGSKVDALDYYTGEIAQLTTEIKAQQAEVKQQMLARKLPVYPNGFVQFNTRMDAEVAIRMDYSRDRDEWVVSTPPDAADVRWHDFEQYQGKQGVKSFLGFSAVVGLYFAYLPLVIGITNVATAVDLGPLQPIWAGLAPTLGLQVMVSFLPTFLLLIFRAFFTLKADTWAQNKLQGWYFTFQVVFVILATAVGQNVADFMEKVGEDPFSTPIIMAMKMPAATHFYMNFLVLQWVAHCQNILRLSNLFKFKLFSRILPEDEALAKAELEDQDYYGMGSRSARFTINMAIGIVFGTLSPPINVLTWINFAVCRVVYGYLIPFAETKKGDLGGVFWVHQLKHLFVANIIYCILMGGVLCVRATSWGPCVIATPSLIYVIWSMKRFDVAFSWEYLPYEDVVESMAKERSDFGKSMFKRIACYSGSTQPMAKGEIAYIQPELIED